MHSVEAHGSQVLKTEPLTCKSPVCMSLRSTFSGFMLTAAMYSAIDVGCIAQ